jgi:hypothetical protein
MNLNNISIKKLMRSILWISSLKDTTSILTNFREIYQNKYPKNTILIIETTHSEYLVYFECAFYAYSA